MASSLAGLRVNTAIPCACGTREAVIGDDNRLRCRCGNDRGRIGPKATAFIAEIIKQFGRPEAPIMFGRHNSIEGWATRHRSSDT